MDALESRKKFYEESSDFKGYVDRFCVSNRITVEEGIKYALVISAEDYYRRLMAEKEKTQYSSVAQEVMLPTFTYDYLKQELYNSFVISKEFCSEEDAVNLVKEKVEMSVPYYMYIGNCYVQYRKNEDGVFCWCLEFQPKMNSIQCYIIIPLEERTSYFDNKYKYILVGGETDEN